MLNRMVLLVVTVALIAAACGDDGSATGGPGGLSGGEQNLADAIAGSISSDSEPDNPFGDPQAARCFSEGLVSGLGLARLAEIGITSEAASPEEAFAALSETEIGAVADLALGCIDMAAAMAPLFATDGISQESALCLARGFEETDFYRQAFVAGMTGDDSYDPSSDPEFLTLMLTMAAECFTAEELGIIMGG